MHPKASESGLDLKWRNPGCVAKIPSVRTYTRPDMYNAVYAPHHPEKAGAKKS